MQQTPLWPGISRAFLLLLLASGDQLREIQGMLTQRDTKGNGVSLLNVRRGIIGAPNTIRTCDPRLRRAVLYPAELWAQIEGIFELGA